MCCGHIVESCCSEWYQSALTATISTTSAWNYWISAVRDPVSKIGQAGWALRDLFSYVSVKVVGCSTLPNIKNQIVGEWPATTARNVIKVLDLIR